MNKTTCIIGAGAMGCLFASRLHEAGSTVICIDHNPQTVSAVNAGIILEEDEQTRKVQGIQATTDYKAAKNVDLLLILVKSPATYAVAEGLKGTISSKATVLSLQNGLGNTETLQKILPPGQITVGVTGCGATSLDKGRIRVAGLAPTIIGEPNGSVSARITAIANVLNHASLPTTVSSNIKGMLWTKLLANIGINAIAALTGLKNGQIISEPDALALASSALAEAVSVAEASGVLLETSDPIQYFLQTAKKTANNDASMLQDVRAKKKTEIRSINAEIAQRAQRLGIPAPVNVALAALVSLREKGYENL